MRRGDRLSFISYRQFLSMSAWLTRGEPLEAARVGDRQMPAINLSVGSIGNDYLD
jgi:hypothetical protein